ncbi:hypothetical protein NADFUDRAFT_52998 [Nadsonia fulvescens var. elongata DSM 6958]|uniref:RNA polymerase II-associated protein 1 C-terminal domain-containing protein n=1 Tax=Nadsonia fulvescens var. elongata DSM 6958 TaxID=857566 RepID=A0A1E3PF27_9ASCO|nr:hypothetical protein NADFUDRAFT_52998 [Nadsonia fulvescens var. elongata DSM 6958]
MDFLNLEIKEREAPATGSHEFSIPKPPQPPQFNATSISGRNGFPALGKRPNRKWGHEKAGSANTTRRAAANKPDKDFQAEDEFESGPWSKNTSPRDIKPVKPTIGSRLNDTFQPETDAERIHLENLHKLSQMSVEEIIQEKEDIMNSFNPAVLTALLKRSETKPGDDDDLEIPQTEKTRTEKPVSATDSNPVSLLNTPTAVATGPITTANKAPSVFGGERVLQRGQTVMVGDDADSDSDTDSDHDDAKLRPDPEADYRAPDWSTIERLGLDQPANSAGRVHFPIPSSHHNHHHDSSSSKEVRRDEKIDVESSAFFEDLHQAYYADLPSEPEKLAWMKPTTPAEREARDADMIAQMSMLPSEIRFDFRGNILAPKSGERVPGHYGLHHHGDQPDLAGYTVVELAHLARSTVPAQRCIAIQTLGRILFRLGSENKSSKGDNKPRGDVEAKLNGGDSYGREITIGIRGLVEQCRVIDSLIEASGDRERHLGVKNYAVEALWLWKQGGGDKTRAAV